MNDEKEVIDEKLITEELLKDEKVQEYLSENEDDILEVQVDIEKTKKVKKHDAFTDFIVAAGAAIVVFLIMSIFIMPSVVVGESMYPTYENGDRFFVIKDWLVSEYEYGDVVCADVDNMTIIKRVIGLPGDTIEIKNDAVYRNGEKVDESEYLSDDVKTTTKGIMHKFVVGEGQYFLLGDNRPRSQDSRYYGLFDELKGKTFFFFKKSWFK